MVDYNKALTWLTKNLLILSGLFFFIIYIFVVLQRINYPFALEWMEGGVLEQTRHILHGGRLYEAPSLDFVPFLYTPIYFYASAFVAYLFGPDFFSLRLLSFLASLGNFLLIFLFVKKESESTLAAWIAAGLFAATFERCGAWFDLARADSLFLLFLLSAIYVLRRYDGFGSAVLAGILFTLSFLTKQIALTISVPIILYYIVRDWRRGLLLMSTVAISISLTALTWDWYSEGFFSYYIFEVISHVPLVTSRLVRFWQLDILSPLAVAVITGIIYMYCLFYRRRNNLLFYYACLACGLVGGGWAGRMVYGGYLNALFPAYAFLAVLFGVAFAQMTRWLEKRRSRYRGLEAVVFFVWSLQFLNLIYNPTEQIPTPADRKAGERLVQIIRTFPGDVAVPDHNYLLANAGKKSHAHSAAVWDAVGYTGISGGRRGSDRERATGLIEEIRSAVRERRFDAFIVNSHEFMGLDIRAHYRLQDEIFDSADVFWPVAGSKIRPEYIYVPRPDKGL